MYAPRRSHCPISVASSLVSWFWYFPLTNRAKVTVGYRAIAIFSKMIEQFSFFSRRKIKITPTTPREREKYKNPPETWAQKIDGYIIKPWCLEEPNRKHNKTRINWNPGEIISRRFPGSKSSNPWHPFWECCCTYFSSRLTVIKLDTLLYNLRFIIYSFRDSNFFDIRYEGSTLPPIPKLSLHFQPLYLHRKAYQNHEGTFQLHLSAQRV